MSRAAATLLVSALLSGLPALAADPAELYRQGRVADAEEANREALEAAAEPAARDTLLVEAAMLRRTLGDTKGARTAAAEALEVAGGRDSLRSQALLELALVDLDDGRYADGRVRAAEALAALENARALRVLAEADASLGAYDEALPRAERALAIEEREPATLEIAATLDTIGRIHLQLLAWDAAQGPLERALRLREESLGPDHPLIAESLANLAGLELSRARDRNAPELRRAQERLERARRIREKSLPDDHPSLATTLNNLGEVYRRQGRSEDAVELWEEALEIWQQKLGGDHPKTAAARTNLGVVLWQSGDLDDARPLLEGAAAAWEKSLGADHPETARSLTLLAAFEQTAGRPRQALDLYRRGLVADDRNLATVLAVSSEEQKLRYIARSQGHYLAALSLVQREFADDPAAVRFALELVLRRKGVVLDAQARGQEAMRQRLSPAARASWQRLAELRSELSKLALDGPRDRDVDDYRRSLAELGQRIEAEESALRRSSPLAAAELAGEPATAAAVAARLPPDGLLVEFVQIPDWDPERGRWRGTSRYLAFTLTPAGEVRLVDLRESAAVDNVITQAMAVVNDKSLLDVDPVAYDRSTANWLGDLHGLLAPALAGPPAAGPLVLSPDGEIHRVPFAALRTAEGRYLVEDRSLSYVASGRDLLRPRAGDAPATDLVMIANPAYDRAVPSRGSDTRARPGAYRDLRFGPLEGAAAEARVIPPLVSGDRRQILGDAAATETAVRALRSPRVLHFATHGFFLEPDAAAGSAQERAGAGPATAGTADAMVRSGLALAGANRAAAASGDDDGILTALEVSGMDLRGTELVVLSACDSASGERRIGEGVYGLRRAFVQAGARNLVMSLWPVRDIVALEQMEAFYRAYRSGTPPPESLRRAQLDTLGKLRQATSALPSGSIAPVRIWAPFIVQQSG